MEISKDVLENMLLVYINHKKMLNEYNKEMRERVILKMMQIISSIKLVVKHQKCG